MTALPLAGLRWAGHAVRVRRLPAFTLVFCAALLGGGTLARADVTIATVANPMPVSFFAGRLAWSAFDPARNGYVLMTHAAGSTSPVPVQVRGVPFDVDLGPDEQGDTVAVYSRCGREPATGTGLPNWRTGRGCDIFKFSFATGRETRVASANGARSSEFLPSIWDTRIAFARVYERRRGRAGDRAYLYARSVLGSGRSLRLRVGPRGSGRICATPQEGAEPVCGVAVEVGPTALDLRGRRLAFAWDTRGDCPSSITGIWLDSLGGSHRLIQEACSTNLQGRALLSPTISGGRVHYVWSLLGGELGTGAVFHQYRISTRRRREVFAVRGRVVMWTTTDAGRTFYLLSGGYMSGCSPVPGIPGAGAPCSLNELAL